MRLLDYASNVHSQNGEDGILGKVLALLPARDKWCVEFGAWDGQYLSNTCHLIDSCDYSAVLIEPDKEKFAGLVERHGKNQKVTPISMFVGFTAEDNLNRILSDTTIPKIFDLLSIDITGNDYHIWDVLAAYTPKVVMVAFNPTIPTAVEFIQPANPDVQQGSSLLSLTQLGSRKHYELVCVTHRRAIFVQSTYFALFGILDNKPGVLREDFSSVTNIFCGYDGTLFVAGREMFPCHNGIRYVARLRQLPKIFRYYPIKSNTLRYSLFRAYRFACRFLGRV